MNILGEYTTNNCSSAISSASWNVPLPAQNCCNYHDKRALDSEIERLNLTASYNASHEELLILETVYERFIIISSPYFYWET